MDKEKRITDILDLVDEHDGYISQREIAEKTGYAIGTVNPLVKKCVKKGLLKMKNLDKKHVRYLLTTKAIKRLTKKTLNYVKTSYKVILQSQNKIKELVGKYGDEEDTIVLGSQSEILDLITDTLDKAGTDYKIVYNLEELNEYTKNKKYNREKFVVFYWEPVFENKLDYNSINIFRKEQEI